MRVLVSGLALVGFAAAAQVEGQGLLHPRPHYEAAFYDWMFQHNVHVPPGQEFVRRLENFITNRYEHRFRQLRAQYTRI